MDSPRPRPEAARGRRARLLAITLWSAFLGAALDLLVLPLLLPPELAHALDWHALSVLFLGTWGVMAVPVAVALLLARPLFEARGGGDGR